MSENTKNLTVDLNEFYSQGKKEFIFNETGNIMVVQSPNEEGELSDEAKELFQEVSVFFAAMTKTISQTVNPAKALAKAEEPAKYKDLNIYYSIYDYDALEAIINGSGYFVHVNREDIHHKRTAKSIEISTSLIEGVLGITMPQGGLNLAQKIISSMGQHANETVKFSKETSTKKNKLANIVFVCENLFGVSLTSAIIVTLDMEEASKKYEAGPCIKAGEQTLDLKIHKDTYMFVPPKFISKYAGELSKVKNDPDYLQLISDFSHLLNRTPDIKGIINDTPIGNREYLINNTLKSGSAYRIVGNYLILSDKTPSIRVKDEAGILFDLKDYDNMSISFIVPANAKGKIIEILIDLKEQATTVHTYSVGVFNISE